MDDSIMLSWLFCIIAEAEEARPCMRVEVCDGGKLVVGLFRHEVLVVDCSIGGGGVTRMASSPYTS